MTTEQIETIRKISKVLAKKYTFGYYDQADIEQEAFIIGMKALDKYNPEISSLETFLYTHISNRLKTFKRDNYYRPVDKCKNCDGTGCEVCEKKNDKVKLKKNIMSPLDIDEVDDSFSSYDDITLTIENEEINSIINQNLDMSLRMDYIKMLHQVYVPKHRREKVEQAIIEILSKYKYG